MTVASSSWYLFGLARARVEVASLQARSAVALVSGGRASKG